MLDDYLGWDYAFLFAAGPFVPWMVFVIFYQKKKKKVLQKKWWFWSVTFVLLLHVFFIQFINPFYLGLGTPDNFTKIHIIDDSIILFDNDVTYMDDERSGTEDYTSHLRIHVVDRLTHKKKYTKLIGDNYSSIIDDNGIYLIENSLCSYSSNDNVVYSVSEFNIETQDLTKIIDNEGTILVEGDEIDIFEIEALYRIGVKSDQGDVYHYNTERKVFEPNENAIVNNRVKPVSYFLNTSLTNKDKKTLIIDNKGSGQEFLLGQIVDSHDTDSSSYVFIKWFKDLSKSEVKYSMLNSEGDLVWSANLKYFEKSVYAEGFEDIQLFSVKDDKCYITINEYLFELDLLTGRMNWWLKL